MIADLAALAPSLALLACLTFVLLYMRVRWENSQTGRNLMSMALCLASLSCGSIVRRLISDEVGNWLILISWVLVAVVMFWRAADVWDATHPPAKLGPELDGDDDDDDDAEPAEQDLPWFAPTPHSIIEPPHKERK